MLPVAVAAGSVTAIPLALLSTWVVPAIVEETAKVDAVLDPEGWRSRPVRLPMNPLFDLTGPEKVV